MIFTADNYRIFIKSRLRLKNYTYEEFIRENSDIMSLGGFQQFISGSKNLSIKTFFRLTRALQLNAKESYFLYLLSLENDLDPRHPENAELIEYLREMRREIIPFLRGEDSSPINLKSKHPDFRFLWEGFGVLNSRSQQKMKSMMQDELRKNISRQYNAAAAKKILSRAESFI